MLNTEFVSDTKHFKLYGIDILVYPALCIHLKTINIQEMNTK